MSEYRALRERYSLLDLCRTPDLATEVTLQPVRRIEVDAAILFSDLLLPLEPMGIRFDFVQGEGPGDRESDSGRSRHRSPAPLRAARGAVARARRDSARSSASSAGACRSSGSPGAPFTLASYAIEGGHSSNFARTKALMYGAPAAWHRLCALLADIVSDYLARADRGRRRRRAGVRFVGRRAERARLPRVHPAPHAPHLRRARASRRADDPFRRRHRRDSRRAARSGRRRHRRRLAHAARRGLGADRPRPRHPGQSRSDAAARPARSRAGGRRRRPGARRRARPGTSSISATAFCPSTPVEHVQALARYVHQQTRRS